MHSCACICPACAARAIVHSQCADSVAVEGGQQWRHRIELQVELWAHHEEVLSKAALHAAGGHQHACVSSARMRTLPLELAAATHRVSASMSSTTLSSCVLLRKDQPQKPHLSGQIVGARAPHAATKWMRSPVSRLTVAVSTSNTLHSSRSVLSAVRCSSTHAGRKQRATCTHDHAPSRA